MDKKVSIILLNYNGLKDTEECIKSLEKIQYNNYEIIVVDNKSTDNSYEELKSKFSNKHRIIQSGNNGGFAFGNNIGIKEALDIGSEYVLLLNNDTLVEEDFLNKLVETAEKSKECGVVCGKIYYESERGKVWFGGGHIDWNKFYGFHIQDETLKDETEITFTTGCLMLIKREVLEKVGFLKEDYFMYYEDVDYCARVLKKAYKIIYNPHSIIYHKVSAATGGEESEFAVYWNTKNRLKLMNRFSEEFSKIHMFKSKAFFYLTRIIVLFKYTLKRENKKSKALLRGIRDSRK